MSMYITQFVGQKAAEDSNKSWQRCMVTADRQFQSSLCRGRAETDGQDFQMNIMYEYNV